MDTFKAPEALAGRWSGQAPTRYDTYRQKRCSHCPRDTGSRSRPPLRGKRNSVYNTGGLKGAAPATAGPQQQRVESERVRGGVRYQREQLSALSSRPSAARVRAQEGPASAMGPAARGRPPGVGWLPERPRNTSRIASRSCSRFKLPARRHRAAAGSYVRSTAPAAAGASRAAGAGRGRRRGAAAVRAGLRQRAGRGQPSWRVGLG